MNKLNNIVVNAPVTLAPVRGVRLRLPKVQRGGEWIEQEPLKDPNGVLVNLAYLTQANRVILALMDKVAELEAEVARSKRSNDNTLELLKLTADDLAESRKALETREWIEVTICKQLLRSRTNSDELKAILQSLATKGDADEPERATGT